MGLGFGIQDVVVILKHANFLECDCCCRPGPPGQARALTERPKYIQGFCRVLYMW
jgi:hypothetical protein